MTGFIDFLAFAVPIALALALAVALDRVRRRGAEIARLRNEIGDLRVDRADTIAERNAVIAAALADAEYAEGEAAAERRRVEILIDELEIVRRRLQRERDTAAGSGGLRR